MKRSRKQDILQMPGLEKRRSQCNSHGTMNNLLQRFLRSVSWNNTWQQDPRVLQNGLLTNQHSVPFWSSCATKPCYANGNGSPIKNSFYRLPLPSAAKSSRGTIPYATSCPSKSCLAKLATRLLLDVLAEVAWQRIFSRFWIIVFWCMNSVWIWGKSRVSRETLLSEAGWKPTPHNLPRKSESSLRLTPWAESPSDGSDAAHPRSLKLRTPQTPSEPSEHSQNLTATSQEPFRSSERPELGYRHQHISKKKAGLSRS